MDIKLKQYNAHICQHDYMGMLEDEVKCIGHGEGQIVTIVDANVLLAFLFYFPSLFNKIVVHSSIIFTFSHLFTTSVTLQSARLLLNPQGYILVGHLAGGQLKFGRV